MNIETSLQEEVSKALKELFDGDFPSEKVQVQQTKKEFEGDKTIVVFPFLRMAKKSPEETAKILGEKLQDNVSYISDFNVINGFLNLSISNNSWLDAFNKALSDDKYGILPITEDSETLMVEFSSPNTNKPLHLGHIRNNLLGYSISKILEANGYNVIKANLVNDRGIHICKSMLAWQKWGNGETPESTGKKGDHLVGEYYVKFDQEYKKEIASLIANGKSEDDAKNEAALILEAREMLRKWEAGDTETVSLWKTMNGWVYEGFDSTYKLMGVSFDKMYYESNTYLLGKAIVEEGLKKGVLYQRNDKSIWCDLVNEGLDEKLLLRPDGTSVYMTQDIGTAVQRFEEFGKMRELIYVVGNEQNYHFQVLSLILGKLGYDWSEKIYHLSYGMVELPEGKMKSREGTVVDADDLINDMIQTSEQISKELGKLEGYSEEEAKEIYKTIALGALKYFILKVEPKKTMTFNPKESIDFNGNTGPFIQYTYARINSLINKALNSGISIPKSIDFELELAQKEIELIKNVIRFSETVVEAGKQHSPAVISNYVYALVKEYNQFYHDFLILKEDDMEKKIFRLALSVKVGDIIKTGMELLGIDVPERM